MSLKRCICPQTAPPILQKNFPSYSPPRDGVTGAHSIQSYMSGKALLAEWDMTVPRINNKAGRESKRYKSGPGHSVLQKLITKASGKLLRSWGFFLPKASARKHEPYPTHHPLQTPSVEEHVEPHHPPAALPPSHPL